MEFLSKVQLFKRMPHDAYTDLASACEEVEFPEGEILIKQGDDGHEFFLIQSGKVNVLVNDQKVRVLSNGDYFGEGALLDNEVRRATVIAVEDTTCLRITREKFEELGLADKCQFARQKTQVKANPQAVFADAAAMKEKLRVAMSKPPYDVKNFYKDTGIAQRVARSNLFDNATLTVIAINALWISIDTDWNTADVLVEANPVFIVAENFFCAYFSLEWMFRFASFKKKRNCLKDAWFCFDSTLVAFMVVETWIVNAIVLLVGGSGAGILGNASILRLFRLLRLSRMARMARLLRAMPELMVLIKGMVVAMRSVVFTLLLLAGIIYIFAIAFVTLMKDTPAGDDLFPGVIKAMNSLLLDGVLPDQSAIIEAVGDEGWVYRCLILVYILLASLTVMNMLVGVLCEVVSVVSSVEKESLLVNYVKGTLLNMLQTSGIDADGDNLISKHEFEALLENPAAAKALSEVGVDVIGLVDFTDFIFKEGRELSFPDFMEMVLQLRGSNTATVKDLVDLRKLVLNELEKLGTKNTEVFEQTLSAFMRHGPLEDRGDALGGGVLGNVSSGYDAGGGPLGNFGGPSMQMSLGGAMMPFMSQKAQPDLQGLSWAAAASIRLSTAATELSAAAGELQARNKKQAKLLQDKEESLRKP